MCLRRSKTAILSAATSFYAVSLHFWNSDRNWLQPELLAMKMRSPTLYEYTRTKKTTHNLCYENLVCKTGTRDFHHKRKEPQSQESEASGPLCDSEVATKLLPTNAHALPCIRGRIKCFCLKTPRLPMRGLLAMFILSQQTCILSQLICLARGMMGMWGDSGPHMG